MTGKQRGLQAGRGQCAEVRDVDAHSAKQADPAGEDKKLQAALRVSQKWPGAPRETNPASGYGVSCLASLL